jgi:hypothetical protein
MYVDSEHDNFHYQYDMLSSEKKPFNRKILNSKITPATSKGQEANKFYSEGSSEMEKVIVCSVISSVRPEGNDESLTNT